ncbi:phage holin family protein [Streptococcus iniae]|uniref:phage holin family protein n=1 Tax=Streptococcus iniae TaxID=1346 RepID=UPI000EFD645A|nr:phage holin family protein [Streptococcus iniae]ELY5747898.1 phage holin family protein [Streptococcus iniae]RMI73800.1 holin [Streptococcus iniae]
MRELVTANKVLFSTIGGLLGSIFGEVNGFLFALLVFITIDYLTGIMAAVVEKNLSSAIGFKGLFKKVVLLFLVAIGQIIDNHILKQGGIVRTTIIFFYLSNEGLSIIENASRIGLPVPEKLKMVLKQLKKEE